MRFNFITNFTKCPAIARKHLSRRQYTPQCRRYTPSQHDHHHHFRTKSIIVSEPPFQFSLSYFSVLRKTFTSKSSNSNMGFLGWYLGLLESRPILTKSISSAIIYGVADVTSQVTTMESYTAWDSIRTLRMASFGLIILGPVQHVWFNFIGRILPKRDMITTFKKLAMGQLFYGPMINGVFFSFNAALQGENGNEIAARLKRDLIPTLLNGLFYWPLCDFFMYKIIPVHLQPLINSSFSYLWTIYLTYMASLTKAVPD